MHIDVLEMPLAERFTIATASWDVVESVFVRVTHGTASGLGEGQPAARWGETTASVVEQLRAVELERLGGPFDLEGVLDLLPAGSARCALDVALHDLAAKLAGVTVAELVGAGGRDLPPTSVTLPIDSPDKMKERARAHAGHPVLKMKVGFDGDVAAVEGVRSVYEGTLRIDANEGWEPDEAVRRLKELEDLDIELCEQPIAAGRHEQLAGVTAATSIPVFADEDVSTASDVARLGGIVDGVNLKLRKAGGLRETLRAIGVARAHGLGVMLGCNLDSGVAATAAASIAALVDHADIDGPLLLASDPFPGVGYAEGKLRLPPGPGLGVREAA